MEFGRAIVIAIIAICLAVFPAGMTRASLPTRAPMAVTHVHDGHDHASHVYASDAHEAGAAMAGTPDLRAVSDQHGDCAHEGGSDKDCAGMCCGFACHAFTPAAPTVLGIPSGRAVLGRVAEDRQVEDGLLFSIERPPRLA